MANTTFTGPVRSEGGFQVVSKNSTTGAYTDIATIASTGIVTDKYVKHVGFATGVTVNTTAGDSRLLVSLLSQQTQSSQTLRYFVTRLPSLELVTLVMKLVHPLRAHKLLQLSQMRS
jgi:hypothetical protein